MGSLPTKAKPKSGVSARVYRAATDTWEDWGIVSGGGWRGTASRLTRSIKRVLRRST